MSASSGSAAVRTVIQPEARAQVKPTVFRILPAISLYDRMLAQWSEETQGRS
ncbi:hypothetical protein O9H85_33115 [Paenibacillus filicis]|uniref:Uncharacterized protein n=1 Tax=Paenibacillus gyeongsangnamensis TaxID=3388067 RepID=A0ABT4QJQ4_9BACL|nr:hypothetical protein [Paenibacillus filicis]MCZ8517108.1 hypothetical protein [Paenibacillus filicis]